MKKTFYCCAILTAGLCFSQENNSNIKASWVEGTVVAGYADHGGFINFTGPNVSYRHHDTKIMIGMLPSLRIKEDHSTGTKNSPVMPTLGVGLAAVYKKIALQVPLYYNSKTATENGSWKMGLGIGYSFR